MNKNLDYWLKYAPKEIKEVISEYGDDELKKAFSDQIKFGTAGIRGNLGIGSNYVNKYIIASAALSYGHFLKYKYPNDYKNGIVIAHDNRKFGKEFSELSANVLGVLGIPVFFFKENELNPTPLLSFAVKNWDFVGGINITASHNPPTDNGFKVYNSDGKQLDQEDTDWIEGYFNKIENIFEIEEKKNSYQFLDDSVVDVYVERILNEIPFYNENRSNLKVTYTPQHGTGLKIIHRLADELEIEIFDVENQSFPDENFVNTNDPNPQNREAFEEAIKVGDANNSDLLFSTDPDADRFSVMVKHQDQWIHLDGNELPIIQLWYILNELKNRNLLREKSFIVRSFVTSDFADKIANDFNVNVYENRTGFKNLIKEVKKHEDNGENLIFVWEESCGSVIKRFVSDKDAFQAFANVVDLAHFYKKQGITLIDVMNSIYEKYGKRKFWQEKERFIDFDAKEKKEKYFSELGNLNVGDEIYSKKIIAIRNFAKGYKNYSKENMIIFELEGNNKVIFRVSGTEPVIRKYFDFAG